MDLFRYKETVKIKLEECALKTVVEAIDAKFDLYSSKIDNANFEKRIKPLLESCEEMLLKCSSDNQSMREAIVDFDMINATKATKWDIE